MMINEENSTTSERMTRVTVDVYLNQYSFLPPRRLVVPAVLHPALHHRPLSPGPLCPLDISLDEVCFLPRFGRGWPGPRLARHPVGVPGDGG